MTILSRYIAREFLKMFALSLAAFIFIYLLVDFIERANDFSKYSATGAQVVAYFAYKIPLILFQVIPAGLLLATLITLIQLARNSELTAMMAGGVSLVRIVTPILVTAALFSAFSFALNEYVVPVTTERAETIKEVDVKGKKARTRTKIKDRWYKYPDGIYNLRVYRSTKKKIEGFSLFDINERFQIIRRIDAESGLWVEDGWEFQNVTVRYFDRNRLVGTESHDVLRLDLGARPKDFATVPKEPDEMNYRELTAYIRRIEQEGLDVTPYRVALQGKLSFPLVGFIMALLAIPFALRTGRQGGVALGIGIAVILAAVFWIALSAMISLGNTGALPPLVAAWSAQVVFLALGAVLLVRWGR